MKFIVILAFAAIITSLGAAGYYMLRGGSQQAKTHRMARALALRVGFSVTLFICILVAWKLGYISPTGIPSGQ